MSDYLSRLAARNLNMAEMVQPRLWSLFEPPSADGSQVFEQHFGYGEQDEVFVSDETEAYAHTSMSPSSPLLIARPAESALPEEVRAETVGTDRQKAADLQTPILSLPQPDLGEAKRHPIPEITENIPVATNSTSSQMASPGQKRSIYSAVAVKTEQAGTVRQKAVDTQPLTSETILGQPLPDPNKTETIPATSSSEAHRTNSQPLSRKVPKQTPPDQRQMASPAVTVKTETVGTIRRKAADSQPPSPETILSLPRSDLDETKSHPDLEKMETIPATSRGETHRADFQPLSRKVPKQTPPDQRQTTSSVVTVRSETTGKVHRETVDNRPLASETILNQPRPDPDKAKRHPGQENIETIPATSRGGTHRSDTPPSSRKVSKRTSLDRRQQVSPALMVTAEKAGTVHRRAVDTQPLTPETTLNQPRPDPDKAKRHPGMERVETTTVVTSNEISPPDQRQQASLAAMVGTETTRRVRQKAVNVPSNASEPILSQPLLDLEKKRRRPGPENAKNLAVTASNKTQNVVPQRRVKAELEKTSSSPTSQAQTEAHPPSRKMLLQSGPVRNRSPKVEIDGEKRTASSRGPTEKELLLAHNQRAAVISQPEVTRFVEPTKPIKTQPTETNPTIQVKIGRVEVRAAAPTAPPPRSAPQPAQKLSLDDYLKQRNGGRL